MSSADSVAAATASRSSVRRDYALDLGAQRVPVRLGVGGVEPHDRALDRRDGAGDGVPAVRPHGEGEADALLAARAGETDDDVAQDGERAVLRPQVEVDGQIDGGEGEPFDAHDAATLPARAGRGQRRRGGRSERRPIAEMSAAMAKVPEGSGE